MEFWRPKSLLGPPHPLDSCPSSFRNLTVQLHRVPSPNEGSGTSFSEARENGFLEGDGTVIVAGWGYSVKRLSEPTFPKPVFKANRPFSGTTGISRHRAGPTSLRAWWAVVAGSVSPGPRSISGSSTLASLSACSPRYAPGSLSWPRCRLVCRWRR